MTIAVPLRAAARGPLFAFSDQQPAQPRGPARVRRVLLGRLRAHLPARTPPIVREALVMEQHLGYLPNLVLPRTFNEKVARRKLWEDPRRLAPLADKVGVREYVAGRAGRGVLNEVYLVTDDPEAVHLEHLPERFVLKANHGSGWNLLVRDRRQVTTAQLQAVSRGWLSRRYGVTYRERWYDTIPPRVMAERLLEDARYGAPLDYKVWVFHGTPRFIQVDFDRFGAHTRTFYDPQWVEQDWGAAYPPGPGRSRPPLLAEMLDVARRLAGDLPFVRVDLYSPNDERVVFGELTLAPGSGWERFWPDRSVDLRLGALW